MALTPDDVAKVQFHLALRPSEGYSVGEVDDFFDQVTKAMRSGGDVVSLLKYAQFPMARHRKGGYVAAEVDALIDRLSAQYGLAVTPPPPPQPAERSWWQKLLGT